MINQVTSEAAKVGLTLSSAKSMYICANDVQNGIISIDNVQLEKVDWFTYLGSRIGPSGACGNEINARICKARTAFMSMQKFWRRKDVTMPLKRDFQRKNSSSAAVWL